MSRTTPTPQLFVAPSPSGALQFRVLTPDRRSVAVTVEATLAAATALAVARHHPTRQALIAASDGRWLEVEVDGRAVLTPPVDMLHGWPAAVQQTLARLSAARSSGDREQASPEPSAAQSSC